MDRVFGMKKPIKVFISYSHKDEEWKDMLRRKLNVLVRAKKIAAWDDREIKPGQNWFQQIEANLVSCDIAIVLVSDHSLDSLFINEEEVTRLLQLKDQNKIEVIPVLIDPCEWKHVEWISENQMIPRDGVSLLELDEASRKKRTLSGY